MLQIMNFLGFFLLILKQYNIQNFYYVHANFFWNANHFVVSLEDMSAIFRHFFILLEYHASTGTADSKSFPFMAVTYVTKFNLKVPNIF